MEQSELQLLLEKGEGLRIEFKEAQNGIPASMYDTIASFLNREGGVVLLGVADDGRILGIDARNLSQFKKDIVTSLNNPNVINPPFPLAVKEVVHGNNILLYIRVPISSFVHKHNQIVYDRVNDSDLRITDEARIAGLYARKHNVFSENQIFPILRITDLDRNLFQTVRSRIALFNTNHPWLTATDERILRDARFIRRDYTNGDEGLTLAAALMFGTDEIIGNILPAYRIDLLVRRNNMDRWDDRLLLKTNLIDSYLKSLAFIKNKWPEKFYLENGIRKDLRELIFRELIANVIIHREYNHHLSTEIIIYEDRVEATNPNRARFSGPLDLNTFVAEPKNPNIRAFFNILSWADEIGSGVKNMDKYVKVFSDGAHPIFIEGETFKSILPMEVAKVGENYKLYLYLSRLSENQIGRERVEYLKHLVIDSKLKNIENLALMLSKYWEEKSGKLVSFRFLINKDVVADVFKKAGSWEEKSGEFLKKRARIILGTLLLTLIPIKMEELVSVLGYKSKERYRDDYVKPLKNNNLISYTIPEKANDPNQAYIITEKGKNFLSGNPI